MRLNIERTDAEAKTPKLWPPDVKNWLIGKDLDAGKDWRREEKGMTEDEMAGWHHWLNTWVWVNSGSWWWTGRPGVLQSMGSQGVRHDWATELKLNSFAYTFVNLLLLVASSWPLPIFLHINLLFYNFSYSLFVKNTNVLYMFSIFHLISSLPLNFYDYFSDKEFFPSIVRLLNSSLYGAGF